MKDLVLSPRLRAIADLVPSGARLADIGTDHAYLPASLLLSGQIQYAIASDVKEGPLLHGKETARKYGLNHKLIFRCCNGMEGIRLEDQIDTVVIAGMGGELIARILSDSPWSRKTRLLLQPMSAQPELRAWLNTNGYIIFQENLVREGDKLYVILAAESGADSPYSMAELWAGRQSKSLMQSLRMEYLNDLIQRRQRALRGMESAASIPPERLLKEQELISQLKSMREEWISWQQ